TGGRIAEGCKECEPCDDDRSTDHLSDSDRLVCQEVAEWERPDHRRDEQRLDDRDAAAVEGGGLAADADDLRDEAEQPHPASEQDQEGLRTTKGDPLEVQPRQRPRRRGERKAPRGKEREKCRYAVHDVKKVAAQAAVPRSLPLAPVRAESGRGRAQRERRVMQPPRRLCAEASRGTSSSRARRPSPGSPRWTRRSRRERPGLQRRLQEIEAAEAEKRSAKLVQLVTNAEIPPGTTVSNAFIAAAWKPKRTPAAVPQKAAFCPAGRCQPNGV